MGVDIYLEDSNGNTIDNPDDSKITEQVSQVGVSIDHCILNLPGGNFVQTSGSANALFVEYSLGGAISKSIKSDFSNSDVAKMFLRAAKNDWQWTNEYNFQSDGNAAAANAASQGFSQSAGGNNFSPGGVSMKQTVMNSIKREGSRNITYMIRRLIRNLLRGKF